MTAALFVAGPAVLLAIMAWAVDHFMPYPSSKPVSVRSNARSTETITVRPPSMPSATVSVDPRTIRGVFNDAEDAREFVPLSRALQRFKVNRSRSIAEDNYPDPINNRYENLDYLDLQEQRVVFQKDGRVRLESRAIVSGRGRPANAADDGAEVTRIKR